MPNLVERTLAEVGLAAALLLLLLAAQGALRAMGAAIRVCRAIAAGGGGSLWWRVAGGERASTAWRTAGGSSPVYDQFKN
jgi:hypothetical protein